MKKLMFATALAASAAAFADPTAINAIGFKGYDLGAKFVTGQAEKDENGDDKAATYGYFCFEGESDSSVVTNDNPSTTKHTAFFASADDAKYLALDTEGGTLWRSIETLNRYPVDGGFVYSNGNARAVASTGTYLDTLVQFTVTEDEEPEVGTDDKLAIWLGVETNGVGEVIGTNLLVKAAVVEGASRTPTTFKLNADVQSGIWYRLTVKAFADITDEDHIPGFQIFLDGNLLTSDTVTLAGDSLTTLAPEEFDDSHYADIVAGKYFASLKTATTLQGVGFKGTGAVDEIVWTEENPFTASGIDFTLAWDANVTAVSYTIDGTTTDLSSETSPYTITGLAADAALTVNASAVDWYVISSGTGAVTAVAGGTNEIVAVLAATPGDAGATGLPASVSTAAAKAWADANSLTPAQIAASTFAEKAYLLNTGLDYEPTFAITAIEEITGGWQITVEAKYGSATVDLEEIRGTLKVKTGATLAALASATSTTIETTDLSFDSEGKAVITITGSGKNFIKATVE